MKPENVILGENGNGIHIQLCDFATAKDVTSLPEGERARTFVGSAEYISPELLGCDKECGKYTCYESDIWAAGCITYFMLSGLPPFRGDGEFQKFKKVEAVNFCKQEIVFFILFSYVVFFYRLTQKFCNFCLDKDMQKMFFCM